MIAFAYLAAIIHVLIFAMESLLWTKPKVNKLFRMSPADAQATKLLAFNQGFYNLFLAVGALAGICFVVFGRPQIGWTLVFASCGSMLLASLVLLASGRKYLRPAVLQGTTPLLAVVLGVLAVALG